MERELLLLGLLRQQAMHGYELHSSFERVLSTCVEIKKPTAYLLLERMAAAGWISVSEEREGNRPPRKLYHITEEGEAMFQRLLRENLVSFASAQFSNDVGLAFVDSLPAAEALTLLAQRRSTLAQHLATFTHVPPHEGSLQLVIDHQRHFLTSELTWLDSVIQRLQS